MHLGVGIGTETSTRLIEIGTTGVVPLGEVTYYNPPPHDGRYSLGRRQTFHGRSAFLHQVVSSWCTPRRLSRLSSRDHEGRISTLLPPNPHYYNGGSTFHVYPNVSDIDFTPSPSSQGDEIPRGLRPRTDRDRVDRGERL